MRKLPDFLAHKALQLLVLLETAYRVENGIKALRGPHVLQRHSHRIRRVVVSR